MIRLFSAVLLFSIAGLQLSAQQGFFTSRTSNVYSRITGDWPAGHEKLQGPVKTASEHVQAIRGKDTSYTPSLFLDYSVNGALLEVTEGDSTAYSGFTRIRYSYVNDAVQEITTTTKEDVHTLKYTFGFLLEERYRNFSDRTLNHKATYSYNNRRDTVNVHYEYETASTSWEREDDKTYIFRFDAGGNLVSEQLQSAGGYGHTHTFTYDSLGRVTKQHYLSSCFGSNSCVNAWVTYVYDAKGNIIEEIAEDATIRNSEWCFCYHLSTKYDPHRNPVARTYHPSGGSANYAVVQKTGEAEPDVRISYVYDHHGNWIRKKEVMGKRATVTTRKIVYR
jgi:YD repeat-containing protein